MVNAFAPQRIVASKYGDFRTLGPMLIIGLCVGVLWFLSLIIELNAEKENYSTANRIEISTEY
jgi:hypothetical protein